VQVGAADAPGQDLDLDLARADGRFGVLLDPEIAGGVDGDDLHASPFSAADGRAAVIDESIARRVRRPSAFAAI
jgi:hypothetical protein